MVVLKGIRRNNLYYLKGSAVKANLTASEHLKDNSTELWQMRLGHPEEKSLQALAKQRSVESASMCNLELSGHDVLDKKTKVKIGTTHRSERFFLIVFTLMLEVLSRLHLFEPVSTLSLLLMIYLGIIGYTL